MEGSFFAVEQCDPKTGKTTGGRIFNINAIVRVDYVNDCDQRQTGRVTISFTDGYVLEAQGPLAEKIMGELVMRGIDPIKIQPKD